MNSEKPADEGPLILKQSDGRNQISITNNSRRLSLSGKWTFQIEPEEIELYLRKYDKIEPAKRVDNTPGFVFDPHSDQELVRNGVLYHQGAVYSFEPGDFERVIAHLKRIYPDYSASDDDDDKAT